MKKTLIARYTALAVAGVVLLTGCASPHMSQSQAVTSSSSLLAATPEEQNQAAESTSSTPSQGSKMLPLAITLTRWGGTGNISKTIIEGKSNVEKTVKLFDNRQPLADADSEIEKRSGGTAMTAKIQVDLETSYTVNIFYGTPQSLGYEVLVIRGETEKHYTEAQAFDDLLQIIENDPQTEYFGLSASLPGEHLGSNASSLQEDAPEGITNPSYYDDRLTEAEILTLPPMSYPEDTYFPDTPVIDYSILPPELCEQYSEDNIIVYSKLNFKPSPNIELWHRWQKSFAEGKPDQVLLYLDGYGFPSAFYELIADGTASYTIKSYNRYPIKEYHSSEILCNDFFICFAPEVKELTGSSWTYCNTVLYSQPMNLSVVPYATGSNTSLGDTTPEEAIKLALVALENMVAQDYRDCAEVASSANESTEPKPHSPQMRVRIIGALNIYGHPCYVIKSSSPQYDQAWDRTLAVNADGGNLVFLSDQMGGDWFLWSDANMQRISYTQ